MGIGQVFIWEFLGTAALTLLGCGVVATTNLKDSLGHNGGWLLINFGWGFAVFVGASIADPTDGHINPAVTFGMALNGQLEWSLVPVYWVAQILGGLVGAVLCWASFKLQFDTHDAPASTGTIFHTAPTVRRFGWNLVTEIIATFVLVFWIILTPTATVEGGVPDFGNDALGYAGVAFVVIVIGTSLGGPTGYAINPARDLGPRIAYAILPIRGKGTPDWSYAWVPIVGPLIGGGLAGLVAAILPST